MTGIFPNEVEENTDLTTLAALFGLAANSGLGGISPDLVAGLQLWLKVDALTPVADSTPVATWTDSSGLGKNAVQAVAANMPSYLSNQSNGKPALAFDGTDLLGTPAITIDAFTMLAVFKVDVDGGSIIYEHGADTNVTPGHYLVASNNYTMLVNRTQQSGKILSVNWPGTTAYRMTTQMFNRSHTSNTLYLEGALQAVTDGGAPMNDPIGGPATTGILIGARVGPAFGLTGKIAEVILYDSFLDAASRQGVECYLSNKYGLAVVGCP